VLFRSFSYFGLAAAALLLTTLFAMAPALFARLIGHSKLALVVVFLASACLVGAGIRLTVWSAAHPHRDTLIYSLNRDENKAKWVSYDARPDAWTSRILGLHPGNQSNPAYTGGLERPILSADATTVPLSAPSVVILQNAVLDGEQTIRLRLASTREARSLVVRLPGGLKVTAAGWNGNVQTIAENSSANLPWTFRFYNAPSEGASLELRFPAQHPIRIWIADTTPGLPAIAPFSARPNDTTPAYGSDVTLVTKALDL